MFQISIKFLGLKLKETQIVARSTSQKKDSKNESEHLTNKIFKFLKIEHKKIISFNNNFDLFN